VVAPRRFLGFWPWLDAFTERDEPDANRVQLVEQQD
jgi:hypothetical protein